jgi:hypothetical protein
VPELSICLRRVKGHLCEQDAWPQISSAIEKYRNDIEIENQLKTDWARIWPLDRIVDCADEITLLLQNELKSDFYFTLGKSGVITSELPTREDGEKKWKIIFGHFIISKVRHQTSALNGSKYQKARFKIFVHSVFRVIHDETIPISEFWLIYQRPQRRPRTRADG